MTFVSQESAGSCRRTLNRRRLWMTGWPGTRQEALCIRSCHSRCGMWHSVAPCNSCLMYFDVWKCFESGLPGTGDKGRKNRHQSAGLSEGTSQYIDFLGVSSCPVRSCGVACHVSASWRWLTRPQVVKSRWQLVFYLTLEVKAGLTLFSAPSLPRLIWSKIWCSEPHVGPP